jgi:8-oxo-dGTP diphosphatase
MCAATVHVVAGAVFDAGGRVLIAQRPHGRHMAGEWEFPGGKLAVAEPAYAGLVRELREELGIEVCAAVPVITYPYDYPDKRILLDLWRVVRYRGEPRGLDRQALRWVTLEELPHAALLAADRPMIAALMRCAPPA